MQVGGRLTAEEFWARVDAMEQRVRGAASVLPCYGLAEWSGLRLSGDWEWEDGRLRTAGLAHGDPVGDGPGLHVRTVVGNPRSEVTSLRMRDRGDPHDTEQRLRRHREAETVTDNDIELPVDGVPVRFQTWRERELWWGAAEHAGFGLVVEARRMPPESVALVRVYDIEPYLAGRRQRLRELRGEA
jgi:hypothetical protein